MYEIRCRYRVQKQKISEIAREMGCSRPTVHTHINTVEEPVYKKSIVVSPRLGELQAPLIQWLEEDAKLARRRQRTGRRIYECLQTLGYKGAYWAVCSASSSHGKPMLRGRVTEACVPMVFTAAEACRFDWSDVFVMADCRESLEMALDTHGQAFTFFGGAPAHMMDDPLKTVVDTICAGGQRRFNRRFVSCESRHRKRFLPLQSSKKSSLQSNGLQLCKLENFGR